VPFQRKKPAAIGTKDALSRLHGGEMYAHACKVGLEGVVSKIRDSRYASGRFNDWVKKTCAREKL
jgi:ATP-dependent DNA ligase